MEQQVQTGYKFIKDDMSSAHGDITWKVGKWQKYKGELHLCNAGFHWSSNALDSLNNIWGNRWFKIEAKGRTLKGEGINATKNDSSELRLVQEIPTKIVAVRFAFASARRVLDKFEVVYSEDKRPRKAIEAAEAYAINPTEENRSAAESAAESAMESAAWSAAWSAASAMESAAWSAASAEITWQRETLEQIINEVLAQEKEEQ